MSESTKPFYRVELDGSSGCVSCGHGQMWTIVSGYGDDEYAIGQSWGDRECADDICDLMNMAFKDGQENATDNAEEQKLVEFFRSKDGARLGAEGDYKNWSPAETAIAAMRRLTEAPEIVAALKEAETELWDMLSVRRRPTLNELHEMWERRRAAIAKAEAK